MKISFDLDGTAWKFREAFKELAHCFKARGHEVGILTGHDDTIREADLHLWTARGFPPADFLLNADDCQRAGIPWHGASQRQWKLKLALKNGVSMHFDDWGTLDRLEFVPFSDSHEEA